MARITYQQIVQGQSCKVLVNGQDTKFRVHKELGGYRLGYEWKGQEISFLSNDRTVKMTGMKSKVEWALMNRVYIHRWNSAPVAGFSPSYFAGGSLFAKDADSPFCAYA